LDIFLPDKSDRLAGEKLKSDWVEEMQKTTGKGKKGLEGNNFVEVHKRGYYLRSLANMSDSSESAPDGADQVVVDTSGLPKEKKFFVAVRTRRRGHAHKFRVTYDDGNGWYIETGGFYENKRRERAWVGSIRTDGVVTARSIESRKVIAEIARDTATCCIRYARSTGCCIVCRALLENRKSVRLGIGPVCREKHKWVLDLQPGNLSDESGTDSDGSPSEAADSMDNFVDDDSQEDDEGPSVHRRLTNALGSDDDGVDTASSSESSNSLEELLDDDKDDPQVTSPRRPHRKNTVEIRLSISGWSDDDGYDISIRRVRRSKRRVVECSDDDEPLLKRVRQIHVDTE
jgi:hypothetical protein